MIRLRWRGRACSRSERGSVTAEFALVIPAVVLVLGACLAAVQVSAQQAVLQDAAASAARAAARGSGDAAASSIVARLVPDASMSIVPDAEFVCVELALSRSALSLPVIRLEARSCSPRSPL